MKSIVALALGAALLPWTSVAWSQDGKPQPEQRRSGKPGSVNARLDEQIRKLQALHERLTATAATLEERQKAMSDARTEMQASIAMMRLPTSRGGPSGEDKTLSEDAMEGLVPGRRGGGVGGGGGAHTQVAAKRTELMLMVMQLIVDQQALLAAPVAGNAAPNPSRTTAKSAAKSAKSSDATPKK
jgi:hypothetical protein